MSKIQIESNSQLSLTSLTTFICCIYHVKDTNRKQFTTLMDTIKLFFLLYLSCQRYKSKAIHNYFHTDKVHFFAVFIMSKIQIESNSQPYRLVVVYFLCCIYHVKDTNRKQFTTRLPGYGVHHQLYLSCQRYKSKAIHNSW